MLWNPVGIWRSSWATTSLRLRYSQRHRGILGLDSRGVSRHHHTPALSMIDQNTNLGLAARYLVDDLPGARQVGARLNGILCKIEAGESPSAATLQFLAERGLEAIRACVISQRDWSEFSEQAEAERRERIERAEQKAADDAVALAQAAESRAATVKQYFAERENDPVFRRRRESKELRNRFGIGNVDADQYRRIMRLLSELAAGRRLSPSDVAWLRTEADYCWTDAVSHAWHTAEAKAFTEEWERSQDPWTAVNASGHWRKAGEPRRSLDLTAAALNRPNLESKLRSALTTTRGGAMRDLARHEEAMALAFEAHALERSSYRPCTLLGALHMEAGNLAAGHSWYEKAEELGAPSEAIDGELRALMARCAPEERERIRRFLLQHAPDRFAYLGR